jgi:hypothetical protein
MMPENQRLGKESVAPSINNRPEEYLQETIIISPQTGQQRNQSKPPPLPEISETIHNGQTPFSDGKTLERDLAETIIQQPVKKP